MLEESLTLIFPSILCWSGMRHHVDPTHTGMNLRYQRTVCRPDFLELAQCNPAAGTTLNGQPLAIGISGQQALEAFPCRASTKVQRDARQSFVSGALLSFYIPSCTKVPLEAAAPAVSKKPCIFETQNCALRMCHSASIGAQLPVRI